jgi:hypothetical protein
MTPFDLIGTERYRNSPFSIPCPSCGSVATYDQGKTKTYPTNASQVAVDDGGADGSILQGVIFGECRCNNRTCQEYVRFVGAYVTERSEDEEPVRFLSKFIIKGFFPAVPLIPIPSATPSSVTSLLKRSFATAFMDQSASGNLLRSAMEAMLTERRVARFNISNGRRTVLPLHQRILRLPQAFPQKDQLLAIKWIGNVASHDQLDVEGLRIAFRITEAVLENLYGTKKKELLQVVKRINRRKGL